MNFNLCDLVVEYTSSILFTTKKPSHSTPISEWSRISTKINVSRSVIRKIRNGYSPVLDCHSSYCLQIQRDQGEDRSWYRKDSNMADKQVSRRNASHFKKLSSSEQVLQCPEMYIGSMILVTEKTLVYDYATKKMAYRPITFTPGFIHVYFEALCNAADNKAYGTDTIEITFNKEEKEISIENNGMGVPIEWMPNEKMWVPTLIFGVMCTSSQYGVTGKEVAGKNGLGIKVCNILANKFKVETVSFDEKLHECPQIFTQEWTSNMAEAGK